MATRRPHAKSRRGCVTCKSRHVRCDEGGPPCNRCLVRGTPCEYASPKPGPEGSDSSFTSGIQAELPRGPNKRGEVAFPETRHLLELQLMHRWSALTYKSCCSPGTGDDEVWQFLVVELGIQYDFLLNGVFALTAFEMAGLAKTNDCQRYVNAAVEYHGLAISRFRSQLPLIDSNSHEAALCMSLMLIVLAFASAQAAPSSARGDRGSMVQSVITHFELVRGCNPVLQSEEGYAAKNPYLRRVKRFEDLTAIALDPRVKEAFTKLGDLNDKRITSSVRDSDERRMQQVAYWEACKKALALLRECYEKCVDDVSQGHALGWLNMAGEEYVKAVKEEDSIALLMLMYWGVLLDKMGQQVWWAQHFGSMLVNEISDRALDRTIDPVSKEIVLGAQDLIETAENERSDS